MITDVPTDPADSRWGVPGWPEWVSKFRDHQIDAVEEIIANYAGGVDVVLLDAPTGCLSGDTMIGVNRGGKGFQMPLREIVARHNGAGSFCKDGSRRKVSAWRTDIPTMVQYSDGETMRLGEVSQTYESGVKPVYRLTTEAGRSIVATLDHRFQTDKGWRPLGNLNPFDKVFVNLGQGGRNQGRKSQYKIRNYLYHHPNARRRNINPKKGGWSVTVHRLVVEADMNGMEYEAFVAQCKVSAEGLVFLDPKVEVHHIDGDSFNNDRSNLEVLDGSEHQRLHAFQGRWRGVGFHIGLDTIYSIESIGEEMTYDIAMKNEPHNFIANEFVVHNSGKTIIAEASRRLLGAQQSAYVANTNSLLDQFMGDFGDYASPLKGKRNYPTFDHPEHFTLRGEEALTCADCMPTMAVIPACSACPQDNIDEEDERRSLHCPHCHPFASCPYRAARGAAAESPLVVTNTSYFIADTQLSANSILAGRGLVIVDECDTLESILMGHIEVNISKRLAQELDLHPPERKTVEEAWIVWLEDEAKPKIKAAIDLHKTRKSPTKQWLRKRDGLARLQGKLATLTTELANGNAVYDGYDKGDIIFRPVKVDTAAPDLLWAQARRWLCMSATLFPDEFVDSMGLNHTDLNVAVVRVPSTFPVERRPIYFKNVANNTYKERDTAWPAMANGIRKVLASRPEARTLIHTVSYGFTQFLDSELSWDWSGKEDAGERDIIACLRAGDRGDTIEQLKKSTGGVLLGPGFDRGIDLPGDDCELIIIPKIPYASTNDKQVQKRMYSGSSGQIWYATQTLKSLVQMTGRGMRSEDDLCECFILDGQFLTNIWRKNRWLLPHWWVESVDFGGGGI